MFHLLCANLQAGRLVEAQKGSKINFRTIFQLKNAAKFSLQWSPGLSSVYRYPNGCSTLHSQIIYWRNKLLQCNLLVIKAARFFVHKVPRICNKLDRSSIVCTYEKMWWNKKKVHGINNWVCEWRILFYFIFRHDGWGSGRWNIFTSMAAVTSFVRCLWRWRVVPARESKAI